jgi:hypothetical protein
MRTLTPVLKLSCDFFSQQMKSQQLLLRLPFFHGKLFVCGDHAERRRGGEVYGTKNKVSPSLFRVILFLIIV